MPQPQNLAKAQLIELVNGTNQFSTGKTVTVQFNPQSLKLSYSNQVSGGNQSQGSSPQFAGTKETKLTMELWFDVTLPLPKNAPATGGDVRKLTAEVVYFLKLRNTNSSDQQTRTPPKMQFQWGSFLFSGIMETMDETIDLFSPDGVPLRASVNIGLSKHDIDYEFANAAGQSSNSLPGTTPLATAAVGSSLQQMAAQAGISNWQGVAQANGITNPRMLQAGTMINLSIST